MEEIVSVKKCSGCTACMNICPKKAITMVTSSDGFKYPQIDQDKCINCGLCKKNCPVLNNTNNDSLNHCYVGYALDDLYKEGSSSGGIFPLIANAILENSGIVIGAAFDENNKLKHVAIEKVVDLIKLKGSKYLQSDLDNIFSYIKNIIKDRKILFVGTPCQVAGLKIFIKNDYNNLYCIDLVCHGVPSPKLFDKYIKELEEINNDKVINYNFRDKSTGWDTYSNTIEFKNSRLSELQKDNRYMNLFLSDVALRESCYNCNFKLGNKYSDITLGDFWNIRERFTKNSIVNDNTGISFLMINSEKGIELPGLGADAFASMNATFSLTRTTHSQALMPSVTFTSSSSSMRNMSSSENENFMNDSTNSILQTYFIAIECDRFINNWIFRHLITKIAYVTSVIIKGEYWYAHVIAMCHNIEAFDDEIRV